MLDKKICKQCHDMYPSLNNVVFDALWTDGFVVCPRLTRQNKLPKFISNKADVPEWCPYALEQLMEKEKRNE